MTVKLWIKSWAISELNPSANDTSHRCFFFPIVKFCLFRCLFLSQIYPELMKSFIDDDHDHSVCAVAESVQIYTVPTLVGSGGGCAELAVLSFVVLCGTHAGLCTGWSPAARLSHVVLGADIHCAHLGRLTEASRRRSPLAGQKLVGDLHAMYCLNCWNFKIEFENYCHISQGQMSLVKIWHR